MAVSKMAFKIVKSAVQIRLERGETLDDILNSYPKLSQAQADEIREIKKTTAEQKAANMPEAMIQNIVKGRMAKFFKESCLLSQEFIQDSKLSVEQYLQSADKELTVVDFKRFTLRAE